MPAIILIFTVICTSIFGIYYFFFKYLAISSSLSRKIEILGYIVLSIYIVWQFIIKNILMNEFYSDLTYIMYKLDEMFIYLHSYIIGTTTSKSFYDVLNTGRTDYIDEQLLCSEIITAGTQIVSSVCIAIGRFDDIAKKRREDNMKNNKQVVLYKPNLKIYALLFVFALVIITGSACFLKEGKLFAIASGIGSGAIASIIIAFLIEYTDSKQKNIFNQRYLDRLFDQFDLSIQYELSFILKELADNNSAIELEREYTIDETIEIIKKANGVLSFWNNHYNNIGVYFSFLDASTFLVSDLTKEHLELYKIIKQCVDNHHNYNDLTNHYAIISNEEGSYAYDSLCNEMEYIKELYKIRGKDIKIIPKRLNYDGQTRI